MPSNLNSRYDLTFLETCIDHSHGVDLPIRRIRRVLIDPVDLAEFAAARPMASWRFRAGIGHNLIQAGSPGSRIERAAKANVYDEGPEVAMNRIRPHVTGIVLGVAVSAWIATRETDTGLRKAARGTFLGIGVAVVVTHLLQRVDESMDSRRTYRQAKSGYLEAMTIAVSRESRSSDVAGRKELADGDAPDWLTLATDAPVHMNETMFDEPAQTEAADRETVPTPAGEPETGPDPKAAFDSAIAEGSWIGAFEALKQARVSGTDFGQEPKVLDRLRKSSMEEIFQRMHSGTVREDVAVLAQAVVATFPESTEGKTLAQVIGVLRRSAGLCPRCAQPYRGIASACHDCLKGTPEAYQIAWDDDSEPTS